MGQSFSILNVVGPFREPREPAFSYDFTVQRPQWPTPQALRVKIAMEEELACLKSKIPGLTGGSPGQQLRINQLLTRAIADQKVEIASDEGMFDDRRDVMIDPFVGHLAHLFPRLEAWMNAEAPKLQEEIRNKIGLS